MPALRRMVKLVIDLLHFSDVTLPGLGVGIWGWLVVYVVWLGVCVCGNPHTYTCICASTHTLAHMLNMIHMILAICNFLTCIF